MTNFSSVPRPCKISARSFREPLSFHDRRTSLHLSSVMRTSFRRVRQSQTHNHAGTATSLALNIQCCTKILSPLAHIAETETLAFAHQPDPSQSRAVIGDPKHEI